MSDTATPGLRICCKYALPNSTAVAAHISLPVMDSSSCHDTDCCESTRANIPASRTMISLHLHSGMESSCVRVLKCRPRSSMARDGPSLFATFSVTPTNRNTSAATRINSSIQGSSMALFV
eukprot:3527627-Rhodomonas_salina.1